MSQGGKGKCFSLCCLQPLAICRRFFRILFRAVFTAKSGIYLNQCVNRKIPMNTAIETIEKCSDAKSRHYFTSEFFRFTRPKPDNRTKFSNSIFQQPARFTVKSRRPTRFLGIFGIVTTLLFVGKGTRTGRPFGFASIRLFRIFAYNTLRKTGLSQ